MARAITDTLRPLCVDMDGTLLATDALWESLLILVREKWFYILLLPMWLLKGKAYFKRQIAKRVALDPSILPYRKDVLAFLEDEKASGREIILATASDQLCAERIANYVGIFSVVLGSNGKLNLSGAEKLKAVKKYVEGKEFDYMGNGAVDIPVLKAARRAILVHPSRRLLKQIRQVPRVDSQFSSNKISFALFLRVLRVHQWVKNILLFVPLFLAHKITEAELVVQAGWAFLAFSLCASSAYIVNDLLDLEADRQHPNKQNRPFSAALVQIKTGILLAIVLLAASLLISGFYLPVIFTGGLWVYFLVSTSYSIFVKRIMVLDVLVLTGLYTLRLLLGGIAVGVPISFWLLAFSIFFFLSLAFMKRYAELGIMHEGKQSGIKGRDYTVSDRELIGSIGPASGYLSVLVLALYTNSTEVVELYRYPTALWFIGPLILYWITRMWFLAHRGRIREDPIVFTFKDPTSYVMGALVAITMALASW